MNPDITLPRPKFKKTYSALLTQTGTSAPTAVILQNTLGGTITWTRTGVGIYNGNINLTVGFPAGKTSILTGQRVGNVVGTRTDDNDIGIQTIDNQPANSDNVLVDTLIQIDVYE